MSTVHVKIGLPLYTNGDLLKSLLCLFGHKWTDISGGMISGRKCSRCNRAEFKFVQPIGLWPEKRDDS